MGITNFLRTICNALCKFIYILIIIYLIIFIPRIFGYHPLVVISGSMEPTYSVGSLLYYKYSDYANIKPGDIVVYKYDKHIISHRVYKKTLNGLLLKGDASNIPDSPLVTKDIILGVGTNFSIPLIGYYASFIYNHKYILVILIGILLIRLFLTNRRV